MAFRSSLLRPYPFPPRQNKVYLDWEAQDLEWSLTSKSDEKSENNAAGGGVALATISRANLLTVSC